MVVVVADMYQSLTPGPILSLRSDVLLLVGATLTTVGVLISRPPELVGADEVAAVGVAAAAVVVDVAEVVGCCCRTLTALDD